MIIQKDIELRPDEQHVYEIIKDLVDRNGNRVKASLILGCHRRSIDRYIIGYLTEGKAFFVHGNRGRPPVHATTDEVSTQVIRLYRDKYYDANFAHFTQLLKSGEGIDLSESTVRRILDGAQILSPQARRKTKRLFASRQKKPDALHEDAQLNPGQDRNSIVTPAESHPRRPRSTYFGEMIQMDASLHAWFGGFNSTLHLAIDDATSFVVGARFEAQETLRGYYHVFHQILTSQGIPYRFYTDRRTIFEYRKSSSTDVANDSFTQFSYACMQLGVELLTTSVPQAKGRIERLISTMQSRLPIELRLKKVTTIEQANDVLPLLIADYNAMYALDMNSFRSVFEAAPSLEDIDRFLAVIAPRTVDTGHSIRFENQAYRTVNCDDLAISLRSGTKGLVIRTFYGDLFFSSEDRIYALVPIPSHEPVSKDLDPATPQRTRKERYIPPLSHPWKQASFNAYLRKVAHSAASP